MADKLAFDLVSPERLLLSEKVEMVVLPGEEGDLGVMAGHAPMISQIRQGAICVFEGGAVAQRLYVDGGFAEVTPERCTVIAEMAVPLEDVTVADVDREISDLRDDISIAPNDEVRAALELSLASAEAKRAVVAAPPY
ncbi:MAG: F0F1 ATP synthase subunit epsilon [Alphaproteobacteria bacterium]|nr:F0F1 ATP synthase subunit epsilon [Alphaproteobacteria bacterium]